MAAKVLEVFVKGNGASIWYYDRLRFSNLFVLCILMQSLRFFVLLLWFGGQKEKMCDDVSRGAGRVVVLTELKYLKVVAEPSFFECLCKSHDDKQEEDGPHDVALFNTNFEEDSSVYFFYY